MADNKRADQPEIPSTSAMGWFAVFLAVVFLSLVLFLQFTFPMPGTAL